MFELLSNRYSTYWWTPIEDRKEQPENTYSWNSKVHMKKWEISSVLNFVKDPKFIERCSEHYPEMTTKEIKEILINKQENYTIYDIIHQHEWISKNVINKYVCRSKYFTEDLSEYIGNWPIKIIVDTPEIHDCNLIELTPELQEKAYWWHRWNRRTISHLINREDFVWEDGQPLENKTSKLTVVAKVDKGGYRDEDEPYILIITAFWWDGKAKNEIREDYYHDYEYADLDDMEYRLNHALIVENDEKIEKTWLEPDWLNAYNKKKKQKEIKSIYEKWKYLKYKAFINYVKNYLSDLWRKYGRLEVIQHNWDFLLENQWENKTIEWKQLILVNNGWTFWIIEVNDSDILNYGEVENIEEYRKKILEKNYSQNFSTNVIKNMGIKDLDIPQRITDFRKRFIKKKYRYKEEIVKKILQATEKIKHKVEIDKEWNKLSTIILWNKEYKILEPNLEWISDEKYSSYIAGDNTSITNFNRLEADLDWMRWNNPDEWLNKELASYIITKESEWFTIPWDKFKSFLSELWKETGIEEIGWQLLMLMYLIGMEWNYWYSTDWGRIKYEYPMFRSNVGNVSAKIMLMSVKYLKK